MKQAFLMLSLVAVLAVSGCSRQQSDWEKTRTANTTDAYESFVKKYPSGEFTPQAQARLKELYEERDWQKARDTDTLEGYQGFLKQYPEGKWADEARIRIENFSLASAPSNTAPSNTAPSGGETAPAAPGPPSQSPGEAPPAPAPRAAAPAKRAAAKTPAASHAHAAAKAQGAYGIQLGAFKSGADAANKGWAKLEHRFPKELSGLSHSVSPRKAKSGTLYRLRVANLSEKRANSICKTLKAHAQACVLIRP
ncbi:MAG TPA: SPOR domain-containing protein [Steroidobacteraceae bacterium]|nr:SPOR domain-containing protein [Steroidobacteraceae bacterium]